MESVVATEELNLIRGDLTIPLKNLEGVITYLKEPYYQCIEFRVSSYPKDIFYYLRSPEDNETEFDIQSRKLAVGRAFIIVTWEYRSKKFDDILFVNAVRQLVVPEKIDIKFTFPDGLIRNLSLSNTRAILGIINSINPVDLDDNSLVAKEVRAMVSRSCRQCGKYSRLQCADCERILCHSCFGMADHLNSCKKKETKT